MASELRRATRDLRRRRLYTDDQLEETRLSRCLNLWDLTLLGLGSTLGWVYLLLGAVALHLAGPSVILSFLVAAVAALFAGLCYAEFGSRVPRAGGSYTYTYVTEGELGAFWVGWVNMFRYGCGAATIARALSLHIDWAADGAMEAWFVDAMPLAAGSPLSTHFDLFACVLVVLIGVMLALGARTSASVNNTFVIVNMMTILLIIVAGATVANSSYWSIPLTSVPEPTNTTDFGKGGFFPHGAWGMLRGAAVCFVAFVGFDTVCAAGEEVKTPRSALPTAIVVTLGSALAVFSAVAVVVTMLVPYYELAPVATLAAVFAQVGWEWARWAVTVGAVFGILASLFGTMFPLSRLLYAMGSDGLFFGFFSHVLSWRQVPMVATVVPTVIIAVLAGIFELNQLAMMMCIGTLVSYTVVAACVILLRYRSTDEAEKPPNKIKQIVGFGQKSPSKATTCLVHAMLFFFLAACVSSAVVVLHARSPLVPAAILAVLALALAVAMALQPRVTPDAPFKTPLVPLVPCLSIYVNVHLMIFISGETWLLVAIWMVIGVPFYIFFACCCRPKEQNKLVENIKLSHEEKNGKTPIQIVVESPTPPDTMNRTSNSGGGRSAPPVENYNEILEMQEKPTSEIMPYETEEVVLQHAAVVENNEEKEAKIIDLLDKVIQAEEDTYGEVISLKDPKEENDAVSENVIVHRKSFSELSDAGSDASLGNQVLSKYNVIAQVHREDLPKVAEEQPDRGEADLLENNNEELELVTAFNDSDTNSRTDESGYSDTLDRTALNDSVEDVKDEPYIPPPPPPPPPPFDENFFASSNFKKSYTEPRRPSRNRTYEIPEENKPRESIKSNSSQQGDGNITFGSDRQIHFMTKLNDMMLKRIDTVPNDEKRDFDEYRKRSNSTGNVADTELSVAQSRPTLFLDLKKEIMSKEAAQNLRPVNVEPKESTENRVENNSDEEDVSMARDVLKCKLENIFKNGGPQLLKPRLMKSNPPTPEESYQTDTSSSESIAKLPKMDKNDTIKRQKDRFGEVLNSFRLSFNKDEAV